MFTGPHIIMCSSSPFNESGYGPVVHELVTNLSSASPRVRFLHHPSTYASANHLETCTLVSNVPILRLVSTKLLLHSLVDHEVIIVTRSHAASPPLTCFPSTESDTKLE